MNATSNPDLRHGDSMGHVVQFHGEAATLVDDLSKEIGTRLLTGGAAIVIATKDHHERLAEELGTMGLDIGRTMAEGRYRNLNLSDTLSQFMVDGLPDSNRFLDLMGKTIAETRAAARQDSGIVIFGEMVAHLFSEGNFQAAIRLEQLWDALAKMHTFSLLTAYPAKGLNRQENQESLLKICAEHSAVVLDQGCCPSVFGPASLGPASLGPASHPDDPYPSMLTAGTRPAHPGVLMDALGDCVICMLDTTGRVTSWSRGEGQFQGHKAADVIGKSFSRFYPEEEIQAGRPEQNLAAAAQKGRFEEDTWRVRNDGSRVWARTIITPLKDAAGRLYGYGYVIRDITDHKRTEVALHRSQEQLRHLVDAVQDYAIFMLDPEGCITTWNSGARRIKGYTAAEIIGCHFSCFYTQEDLRLLKPQKELKTAAEKGSVEDEGWRVRKDGSRFWANVVITAVRDEAGKLIGFAKVTRDVTERVQAAMSLRESEERYRTVAESAADAIVTTSDDLRIQFLNPAATRIFGYSYGELIGRSLARLLPACVAGLQDRWTSSRRQTELTGLRKGNDEFPAEVSIAEATKDGQRVFIYFMRDISERKQAERRLSDSEESLRKLSLYLLRSQDEERRRIGRELHDSLGQNLVAIKMGLDALAPSIVPADIEAREQIAACLLLAEDAIKELRTISYLMYPPMLDDLGLQSAVAWYLEGFSQRSQIAVTFDASPNFGRLPPDDELAMFRILQESLTNVHRHSGSPTADVRLFTQEDKACLEVIDHGKGIRAGILADSSQDAIRTLGVGLRGMDERLRQLGGNLEINSSPGGTRVLACLPLREASPRAALVAAARSRPD